MKITLIKIPKILSQKGNLAFLEEETHLPFRIKRAYWIYDIPAGEPRGGHAHKDLFQIIIAIRGSFNVILDDGNCRKKAKLKESDFGLLIKPGIWREITNFSNGAICLVLASDKFHESDYIREYSTFLRYKNDPSLS